MSTPATSTAPPAPAALTVRRLMVDLQQGFDRHWNGGDAFMSQFCNALSMSFPVGEQFFIDAVREGGKRLPATPEYDALRETVRGFIGQEATHRHLHSLYNAQLDKQGLVNHWGPRAAQRLEMGRRKMFSTSAKGHLHELAITAAYEHFTAIFGHLTVGRIGQAGDWFAQAQAPLQTLWRWHAAEESEHQCVAFDLYVALGGNHAWRVRWFNYVMVQFALDALRQTLHNLWRDGSLWKVSTWRSAWRFVAGRHGLLRSAGSAMWAYRRPDFHPSQLDDGRHSQRWLAEHQHQWTAVSGPKTQNA